jgi:hypothetical protein
MSENRLLSTFECHALNLPEMNHKRLQPAEAQRLLRALFIGAEIATFEYLADFIVRLERNLPHDQQEIEHELID